MAGDAALHWHLYWQNGLATIFGFLMGNIRRRAGGMLAPWVAHVFTDTVIAGILIGLVA